MAIGDDKQVPRGIGKKVENDVRLFSPVQNMVFQVFKLLKDCTEYA